MSNQSFIANLKAAIRLNEQVSIGGGTFWPDELQAVLEALELAETLEKKPMYEIWIDDADRWVRVPKWEYDITKPDDRCMYHLIKE